MSFFESKGCFREKSSSLVPLNDPTLLFTSAGMVQFKDVFTGNEKRSYTRATTAQKCVRAGGKHNDLENVGFTARHHTFFEMMGNFSFGDYFKKEAISWAWELATEVFQMPKERLHVTVFRTDDEAYDLWHKVIGVPKERIYRFDEKDNFWAAGDVGPCGPCTEIYFDRGESFNTGDPELDKMGGDGGRYLEFYNLVFMQYNRDAQGNLSPLPKPSVDTGLGLERTASILQNVPTNYDIDTFQILIQAITQASKAKYKPDMKDETSSAIRVVADHLRAVSFLIADGVLPSNDGRGYVLRRILRRAVRYGKKLGFTGPFLYSMVPALSKAMGDAYPELKQKEKSIQAAIQQEEEKFFETLERGLKILGDELKKSGKTLPGSVAFLLYDSFGFPLDLTQVICKEQGITVNEKEFEALMEKQRSLSRGSETEKDSTSKEVYAEFAKKIQTKFIGYQSLEGKGKVIGLIQNGASVSKATGSVEIVLDQSVFYGEGGGQVGDQGQILVNGKVVGLVKDAKKPLPELIVLKAELSEPVQVQQELEQKVQSSLRRKTMANHTATHLLHWALRKKFGTTVKQAGSLVNAELLRFDFTHAKAMSAEELSEVESMINEKIAEFADVRPKEMTKDEAIAAGAVALFGEKYGDSVRTLKIGDGYSFELCGGTHVDNTAQIGCFVIVSEGGVAAGVRRIVAYTGMNAVQYLKEKADALDRIRESFKAATPADTVMRVEKLQTREKELEKKISQIQAESAGALAQELVANPETVAGIPLIRTVLKEGGAESLKVLGERIKDRFPRGVVVLGAIDTQQNKVFLQVQVNGDLTKTFNAGKLVQSAAPCIDGKGGGKPEQAQAGGTKISGIEAALDLIVQQIGK